MTGYELRQLVCKTIKSWVGGDMGSDQHKDIVNTYNSFKPLARGYTLKMTDAYCAATVSAAFIKAGIAPYTGTEVGVQKFVAIAQQKGYWMEKDSYVPRIGDVLVFDWEDDGIGDNVGDPNHMGIVTAVNVSTFEVTEGNMGSNHVIGSRTVNIDGLYIRGFMIPDYDTIAKQLNGYQVEPIKGIDVSVHNSAQSYRYNKLDWAKIKADGCKFAIIRTGYGITYKDPYFDYDITSALEQGLKVGVYHFSYALNVGRAKQEAEYVLKILEPYKGKIELPVFYDFEGATVDYAKKNGVTLGKNAFNNHTKAFCEIIENAGYLAGTYYNLNYRRNWVDDNILGNYTQWFAQYNSTASWTDYDIWQYSSTYKIDGHKCNFDVNLMKPEYWNQLFYKEEANAEPQEDEDIIQDKYYLLGEVTNKYYRPALDKLIEKKILTGRGGKGDNLIIDLSEESIRLLVMLDRAGVFDAK